MLVTILEMRSYLGLGAATGTPAKTKITVTDENKNTTLREKGIILFDDVGTVGVWFNVSGGGTPGDDIMACDRRIEITDVIVDDDDGVVASALAGALDDDAKFSAVIDANNEAVIHVTSSTNGPKAAARDTNDKPTDFILEVEAAGTDTDDDEAFLTQQINVVSNAIEGYTRRKFLRDDFVQTFYSEDYRPSSEITLSLYPVNSVASVVVDDTTTLTDYRIHKPSGTLIRKEGFHRGEKTVISFDAGFDVADIPADIKEVVYSVVSERYNKKKSGVALNFGSDVQRVSIPGTISIDFDYTLSNNDRTTPFGSIIGDYLNVLDFHRSDRAVLGSSKLEYVEIDT